MMSIIKHYMQFDSLCVPFSQKKTVYLPNDATFILNIQILLYKLCSCISGIGKNKIPIINVL